MPHSFGVENREGRRIAAPFASSRESIPDDAAHDKRSTSVLRASRIGDSC